MIARPVPSIEADQRKEGGDETPWSARKETDTAEEATEERGPPEKLCTPNASGRRGGEGRGGTPTQQRAPMALSDGAGWDPREAQRDSMNQRGAPSELLERGGPTEDEQQRAPPRTAARA